MMEARMVEPVGGPADRTKLRAAFALQKWTCAKQSLGEEDTVRQTPQKPCRGSPAGPSPPGKGGHQPEASLRHFGLRGTELERAQAGTIRTKLIKIGAVVRVSVRRVVLSLSAASPIREVLHR